MTSYLFQQLINGIQLGSIYALIALGYTMVYGIIKLINFAHADIFMIGAYTAFFLVAFGTGASANVPVQLYTWPSLIAAYLLLGLIMDKKAETGKLIAKPRRTQVLGRYLQAFVTYGRATATYGLHLLYLLALTAIVLPLFYFVIRLVFGFRLQWFFIPALIVFVMAVCALLGAAMEKIAYRPLRHKPRLSSLITAIGVSFFLENFCSLQTVFSNNYQAFPLLVKKTILLQINTLGISINNIFLINITVLAVLLGLLWFLVEKTLIGKQMRAVAFDTRTASLMGIDVNRTITVTFMIGSALAGVSGILYAMNYGILQSPFLGFSPGLKAFIAAVLGGIGSLPGAVVGAFLMGITEVFANAIDSNLGFAAAFMVLIIILLCKPTGIFGKKEIEKV